MQRPLIAGTLILLISILALPASALDWIRLHDEQYKITLEQAMINSADDPGSIDKKYVLALSYVNMNEYQKAKQVFNEMLAADPDIIEARWGMAEISRRQHDLYGSEKTLNEIIAECPDFSPAYISLAYIRQSLRDYFACVDLAKKAVKISEKIGDKANRVRGLCLLAGANGMIALEGNVFMKLFYGGNVLPNLKKAESIDGNASAVLYGLGCYYLMVYPMFGRDLDLSEAYFNRLLEKNPNYAEVYARLAQIYRLKGNKQKYSVMLDKALEIDPKNELALEVKAAAERSI